MNIIQSVTVKQVLTENSKKELLEGYMAKKKQLQKESDQLRFELKKQEKTKKLHPASLKKHFEKEIQIRQEKVQLLDFQIEQLHMLPLGSELKEKEVQAIIEVQKGTSWEDIEKGKTIIIRDGIVDEIR
ncbi:YlqD family protein [Cytobacillus pseudoceanisediminis]|uniref:YlqD family protein n=1 Tax=Cytobacillus pseudoceanisediminis TaxID=3051614 RepID=UPI002163106E|nr:YlqD family protein [Cytobacillus firmus]